MEAIYKGFSDRVRSHLIKVNFYNEKPAFKDAKRLRNVRFCEATKEAILHPVLLDKESIICPGALHAFGWASNSKVSDQLLACCYDKRNIQEDLLKSMLSDAPHFTKPFKYIGLNTDTQPDIIISYLMPEEVMSLIKIYHDNQGKSLEVSLCSTMSVCGGIAVRTYLDEKISFSFGCSDSRKYAEIGRDRLAVGIPKRLFSTFVT
ncbi:MAG: DUF169 domain-containing protein [Candidatus Omnitrophica bacterium]|nr:DUF169 domain-containing protein [Candidatus Omnitrophota bacterium]